MTKSGVLENFLVALQTKPAKSLPAKRNRFYHLCFLSSSDEPTTNETQAFVSLEYVKPAFIKISPASTCCSLSKNW